VALKTPKGHEIHQNLTSQALQKCTEIVIFGMKTYTPSGKPGLNSEEKEYHLP
jgi:hypothetical protein